MEMHGRYTNFRHKLLHHLDVLVAIRDGRECPPVNVEIDLSNRCSLACNGCHFAHTHSKGPYATQRKKRERESGHVEGVDTGDLMDPGLATTIIRQLSVAGVKSITWTGGGEPTLHPRFSHIVAVAAAAPLDQGLYTSGVHVEDHIAWSVGEYLDWAYVSMDCHDRESYKHWKRVDAFEKACEGARRLAKTEAIVGVGFLLHEHNYQYTREMAELAISLGAKYVQYRPLVLFDQTSPGVKIDTAEWVDQFVDSFSPHPDIPVEIDLERFRMYANWDSHGYNECLWCGVQTVITPDGRVWVCCNRRGLEGSEIGDLTKERFSDIWARRQIPDVDHDCRVMCRGHLPNQFLHWLFGQRVHENFV